MGKDLVFEIGTEEIPARYLDEAVEGLRAAAEERLKAHDLDFEGCIAMGTPRRLVLYVHDLAERQPDKTVEITGPPLSVAVDAQGAYTKAAHGFARSHGVTVDDLSVVEGNRGKLLAIRKTVKGEETDAILRRLLPEVVLAIPFRKSMRWGRGEMAFVRPIRWVVDLYGGASLGVEIDGVLGGAHSRGHRFHAPEPFTVEGWEQYIRELRRRRVIVDPAERRRMIEEGARLRAAEVGGRIDEDEELFQTVTNLVEYPVVLVGRFEDHYLELPPEVLISVMKHHQKYIPVYGPDAGGRAMKLTPHFVFVSGTEARDPALVVRGNERVLRARFSDAKFFFEEDTKRPLADRVERLKEMVFLTGAGTYWDKTRRLVELASWLADELGLADDDRDALVRAAELAKADLTTQMVFELPELQGTMGRYYALHGGERPKVAAAIEEHYMPRTRQDRLPETLPGALLSLADKADNICACFAVGLRPTGNSDPYALRRQAIALLNIALTRSIPLRLEALVGAACRCLRSTVDSVEPTLAGEVVEFIGERFRNLLLAEGHRADVIEAVFSCGFDDVVETRRKVEALGRFAASEEEFKSLAIAFKRVVNIVGDRRPPGDVDVELFEEEAERSLWGSFLSIEGEVEESSRKGCYLASLNLMKRLKEPVDRFFDEVLVMDEREEKRNNRLALLWRIRDLFFSVADFSKIST